MRSRRNRLQNAILRWIREDRKAFTFRFTGEQTKRMCNGFCKLIKVVVSDVTLSVYPHRASLKNMPGHGANTRFGILA
jgi:hypothetical protein